MKMESKAEGKIGRHANAQAHALGRHSGVGRQDRDGREAASPSTTVQHPAHR